MANPGDSGFIICGMCNEIAADQEGEGEKPYLRLTSGDHRERLADSIARITCPNCYNC
jgi:hypothetical protein